MYQHFVFSLRIQPHFGFPIHFDKAHDFKGKQQEGQDDPEKRDYAMCEIKTRPA